MDYFRTGMPTPSKIKDGMDENLRSSNKSKETKQYQSAYNPTNANTPFEDGE